jgi:peptide chain release factor subunit 1
MLSEEQIDQLAAFDGQGARVLSVYLDLDPATQVRRSYKIALEDLVKTARARLDDASAREAFETEAARVQTWLDSEKPRGKGLAVFSCSPRNLWRADFLAVRVMNHLAFEPTPDVAPLLRIVDEYERYAVAVVDKEKARLFTVFAGEIEESEHFRDWVISKHDQGGWSQARYQRHHEAHVYWHLERVAQRLAALHRRRRFDRLILAGPAEATSELQRLLPRALARRVVAVIPASLAATDREILDTTLDIERRAERETEERLLGQLLDLAGPAGRAVLGVRPTLAALWADMVQTLVVAFSASGDGSDCPNCLRLEPGSVERCPACGTEMRRVHDLFHRAMQRAREQSGSVEIVHGAAEKRLLEVGGGLGALLRYASPVPQQVARETLR